MPADLQLSRYISVRARSRHTSLSTDYWLRKLLLFGHRALLKHDQCRLDKFHSRDHSPAELQYNNYFNFCIYEIEIRKRGYVC